MSKALVTPLLVIAILAIGLLITDRVYRISAYLEGFQSSSGTACGVDLPPCEFPLRCMNGFCRSEAQPQLPATSGLPVLP